MEVLSREIRIMPQAAVALPEYWGDPELSGSTPSLIPGVSTSSASRAVTPDLELAAVSDSGPGVEQRQGLAVRQSLSGATAEGDRRLVERLIANLLDNAIAYNRPYGHVDVAVETRGGHAMISVSNTGPIVPASEVERLLQPSSETAPTAPVTAADSDSDSASPSST